MEQMGKRIQALRKKKHFSQEQLADRLGVSRQAISKWESDKAQPELCNIIAMAEAFDVSTDYILVGKEKSPVSADAQWIKHFIYIAGIVLGCIVLLLLPLAAKLYQSYALHFTGRCFTAYLDYIHYWPIKGILWIGILLILANGFGLWIQHSPSGPRKTLYWFLHLIVK